MQSWNNFIMLIFWISFISFILNNESFFKILIFSEITWIILYCYSILIGFEKNDILLLSTSFFILALAAVEYSIGILLIVLFKNLNKTIKLNSDLTFNQNIYTITNKKLSLNKLFW